MQKLLVISFDAVGDSEFERLLSRPHFAALAARSAVARGVETVFLSNTYPIHTTVVTGVVPAAHGLINNTDPFPARHPRWWYDASRIRARTLWQAAHEKGLDVASVMWPVTGGAGEIRWNIPEIMVQPGENQVAVNLKYGSKLLQLGAFLRHRKLLRGIAQPERDYFATACMADILRKKRPHLALMHLTAFDTLCHMHGKADYAKLAPAFRAMDENLGALLAAAGGEYSVILFADHSQLPAGTPILPNRLLEARGLLQTGADGSYLPADCFFECCGGSAFFHPGGLAADVVEAIRQETAALPGFGRFLRMEELEQCGRPQLPFGFCAQPGFAAEAFETGEQYNHGYPLDYDDYTVFYLAAGPGFAAGRQLAGGSLLQLAPLAAHTLGLAMPGLPPPRGEMLADL